MSCVSICDSERKVFFSEGGLGEEYLYQVESASKPFFFLGELEAGLLCTVLVPPVYGRCGHFCPGEEGEGVRILC